MNPNSIDTTCTLVVGDKICSDGSSSAASSVLEEGNEEITVSSCEEKTQIKQEVLDHVVKESNVNNSRRQRDLRRRSYHDSSSHGGAKTSAVLSVPTQPPKKRSSLPEDLSVLAAAAMATSDDMSSLASVASNVSRLRAKQKLLRLHSANKLAESRRSLLQSSSRRHSSTSMNSISLSPSDMSLTEFSTTTPSIYFSKEVPDNISLVETSLSSPRSSSFRMTAVATPTTSSSSTAGGNGNDDEVVLYYKSLDKKLAKMHDDLVSTRRMLRALLILFLSMSCVQNKDSIDSFISNCTRVIHHFKNELSQEHFNNNNHCVAGHSSGTIHHHQQYDYLDTVTQDKKKTTIRLGIFGIVKEDDIALWLSQ